MDGIGLSEAIAQIRAELLTAQGEEASVRFPVESVMVELKVVATKEGTGKAGFKVPVVGAELGGSGAASLERASTITVVLGAPHDVSGHPVKVSGTGDKPKR